MSSRILIVDFGSQFTQLIARRVREARVYSEIHPPSRTVEWIREWKPTGIIISGGPNSVYGDNVPLADPAIFDIAPVLASVTGCSSSLTSKAGRLYEQSTRVRARRGERCWSPGVCSPDFRDEPLTAWMSHGDHIEEPPKGYRVTAQSNGILISGMPA